MGGGGEGPMMAMSTFWPSMHVSGIHTSYPEVVGKGGEGSASSIF